MAGSVKNVICFCRVAVIAVVTMLIGFAAIKLMFYGKVTPNLILLGPKIILSQQNPVHVTTVVPQIIAVMTRWSNSVFILWGFMVIVILGDGAK